MQIYIDSCLHVYSNQQGYVAVRTLRMLKTSGDASKEDSSKWKIDKTKVLVDQNSPEIKKKPIIKRPFQFSLGGKPQTKGKYIILSHIFKYISFFSNIRKYFNSYGSFLTLQLKKNDLKQR